MPTSLKTLSTEERFADQSRRIRMLEEVFVPMAKAAMEILTGRNGSPGMAEDLRNVRADLEELIKSQAEESNQSKLICRDGFQRIESLESWRTYLESNQQAQKEIKLMGMKISSETKIAIINGIFIVLSSLLALWLSR